MTMLGDDVASALARTAEEVRPGAGREQVRRSSIHLDDIQKRLGGSVPAGEEIVAAIRIAFVEKDPGGTPVAVTKRRGGLIGVGTSTFVLAHEMSMARYYTTMYYSSSLTAAPIEVITKEGPTPGMRVTLPDMSTVAFGLEPITDGDADKLLAIRDRLVRALNGVGMSAAGLRPNATVEVPPVAAPTASDSEEGSREAVFSFAGELLSSAAAGASKVGDGGAFWQVFDPAPEDPSVQVEIYEQRLGLGDSRAFIGLRVAQGFRGIAGFSCLEATSPPLLRVEAFDSRNGASAAMSVSVRRTLLGRYRPHASPTFHGVAEPIQD